MNVFGAFTFGSLIKTFIPGLVWLFALVLLLRDLHDRLPGLFPGLPAVAGQEQTALVLAIPAAILFGLISNILVFMGVNDVLVRNPVRRANVKLFALYDGLCAHLRDEHWATMRSSDTGLRSAFHTHVDAEMLALTTSGINELTYVREQYWYHMEFQVNMLLAVFAMLVVLLASSSVLGTGVSLAHLTRAGVAMLALGALCILLHRAALKNYSRHVAKMCSLLAANLCVLAAARDQTVQPP